MKVLPHTIRVWAVSLRLVTLVYCSGWLAAMGYRLLNCGFRLGVSGGSAIGVMPLPTGYNRVYARVTGAFDSGSYWAAIKAGRSFATSGPILTLSVGKYTLGDTIELNASVD